MKHGLLSREALLPDEDADALADLGKRIRAELRPAGELEMLLVDRIVAAFWRLRRLGRVETGIFAWELYEELSQRAHREAKSYEFQPLSGLIEPIITEEAKHAKALANAERHAAQQKSEPATTGRVFLRDVDGADAFSKLARYETSIERSLYKALHELQRLQCQRTGGDVPPPVAVDVEVSGHPDGEP